MLTANSAVGTFLLLRMLSLNLRSIVRRNLRRLWLTVESPPNVCVIRARDDDEDVILASEANPPFWLGVLWLLLLCVVNNVPHGPEVTTALVRPLDAMLLR